MSSNEERLRAMFLSGTVSIPPRFPDTASIQFVGARGGPKLVVVSHRLSPKVVLTRSFFLKDVTSIFEPDDCSETVDFESGEWYHRRSLKDLHRENRNDKDFSLEGIVYVRENAQSLLEVEAGMSAAESAEYYPPLPDDRSVNHYSMDEVPFRSGCGGGP